MICPFSQLTESEKFAYMELIIDHAQKTDVDELMALYFQAYGPDYPLEIGTNKSVMQMALETPKDGIEHFQWYVMRDKERRTLAGSCIVELDLSLKIGKVTGVIVGKNYQGCGVANRLIEHAASTAFEKHDLNSLYSTSRTVALSSQAMLLKNGFMPLGIFPNARKIKTYETLSLMGRFRPGILEKRKPVAIIPTDLAPMAKMVEKIIGHPLYVAVDQCPSLPPVIGENDNRRLEFEFIDATHFVHKRSEELFEQDKKDTFYPFHRPNLLIFEPNLGLEIFACFTKKDHYCVIISTNRSLRSLGRGLKNLIFAMQEQGIYYIELLVDLDNFSSLCYLMENKFIPSAIYPAMREEDGAMHDYVLLTRTMVPLDFSEIEAHPSLIPYFKLYTEQWSSRNLKAFGDHQWGAN